MTDSTNPFVAMQRAALEANRTVADWHRTAGRMASLGTAASLEWQAALARQGTNLTRALLRSMVDERAGPVPNVPDDEALERAVDEAINALEAGSAGSLEALAEDIRAGAERADSSTESQQRLAYATVAAMLGIPRAQGDPGPVRIEVEND